MIINSEYLRYKRHLLPLTIWPRLDNNLAELFPEIDWTNRQKDLKYNLLDDHASKDQYLIFVTLTEVYDQRARLNLTLTDLGKAFAKKYRYAPSSMSCKIRRELEYTHSWINIEENHARKMHSMCRNVHGIAKAQCDLMESYLDILQFSPEDKERIFENLSVIVPTIVRSGRPTKSQRLERLLELSINSANL